MIKTKYMRTGLCDVHVYVEGINHVCGFLLQVEDEGKFDEMDEVCAEKDEV